MKKGLVAVIAAVAIGFVAMPAGAADEMNIGLGFVNSSAPVGARVWISPEMAIDVGLGFTYAQRGYSSLDKEDKPDDKKLAWTFDAGVPYVVTGSETTKFFIRPGALINSTPIWDGVKREWTSGKSYSVSGILGVEHFFSDWFSIGAAHGLVFTLVGEELSGTGDSEWGIRSTGAGISSFGFHVYPFGEE